MCLVTGCSAPDLGLDTEARIAPPATWTAPGSRPGKVQDAWWKSFGDTKLDQLIAEALAGNFDLAGVAERIAQAEALARMAGADLWPQVAGNAGGSRARQIFVGLPIPGTSGPLSSTATSYGLSLDVSWELDLWGRLGAAKGAAAADYKAAASDYAGATLSLIAQTCKAWFAVSEAKAQLDLAAATLDSHRETAEMVEERYRRGLRPSLDLHLAKSLAASAEAQLQSRSRLHSELQRQVEVLLGRYPKGEIAAGPLPESPPDAPPTGVPAGILRRRPDLIAARHRLLSSRLRVDEARADLLPRLALTASGGTLSDQAKNLLDGDFRVWTILGNLIQPIFQGGRLRARVDLTAAQARQEIVAYANQTLTALADVEVALTAEFYITEQLAAVRRMLVELRAARRLAEERYLTGTTDILLLLEAERAAVNAEREVLALRRQAMTARVDLHLALGGGFAETRQER